MRWKQPGVVVCPNTLVLTHFRAVGIEDSYSRCDAHLYQRDQEKEGPCRIAKHRPLRRRFHTEVPWGES